MGDEGLEVREQGENGMGGWRRGVGEGRREKRGREVGKDVKGGD